MRWDARSSPPGLEHRDFIEHATEGFDAYQAAVEPYTLEYAERESGVPADAIRDLAHAYATADRAMICWTLGITEHHNAVDNVLALINLALLTGHVGRYGSGISRSEARTTCRAAATWARCRSAARLPARRECRAPREVRAEMGRDGAAAPGLDLSRCSTPWSVGGSTVYCIGENPLQSEADQTRARHLLEGLEFLVVRTSS